MSAKFSYTMCRYNILFYFNAYKRNTQKGENMIDGNHAKTQ